MHKKILTRWIGAFLLLLSLSGCFFSFDTGHHGYWGHGGGWGYHRW